MKLLNASVLLLSTLLIGQDAIAQSSPRGPRYNPNRGSSSSTPRSTAQPSTSSRSTTTTRTAPTGRRYDPTPPQTTTTRPHVVTRPQVSRRVITNYRPAPTYYGTYDYHRPYGYTSVRYSPYRHSVYNPRIHSTRYYRSMDWYNYVAQVNRDYIYANWIFYPASGYSNGYYHLENYPYYVYNGYRYRYSSMDYCNYQLVDQYNHQVLQTYWNQTCNSGYDLCSMERDRMNAGTGQFRYFCSETIRENNFDYSVPTYDDRYYGNTGSCSDYDNDGYCDEDYGYSYRY
jgi:hypothetical protein